MHIFNLSSLFLAASEENIGVWIAIIIVALIAGAAAGGFVGLHLYKKSTDKKLGTVEERAKKMVDDAASECKALKREAILEAKEQDTKLRAEFEKESREKKNELNKLEQRLQSKEDTLDKREDSLSKRSDELDRQKKDPKPLKNIRCNSITLELRRVKRQRDEMRSPHPLPCLNPENPICT